MNNLERLCDVLNSNGYELLDTRENFIQYYSDRIPEHYKVIDLLKINNIEEISIEYQENTSFYYDKIYINNKVILPIKEEPGKLIRFLALLQIKLHKNRNIFMDSELADIIVTNHASSSEAKEIAERHIEYEKKYYGGIDNIDKLIIQILEK